MAKKELYQLGAYNTRTDLSSQAKIIRDTILSEHNFQSLFELIEGFDSLEDISIDILKKAIFAGYWDSQYGLGLTKEEELKICNLMSVKAPDSVSAKLQLLRTLQVNKVNTIQDLITEYAEILEQAPDLYYELMSEDLEKVWKDNELLKQTVLIAMLKSLADSMDLEEFKEEVNFQTSKHYNSSNLPALLKFEIDEITNKKSR